MADELILKPKLDPRASKFALQLRGSRIHRFGVFAMEDISKRKRVIEYTGERISRRTISRRLEGEFTYIFMLGFLLRDRRSGRRVRGGDH
jgi:uncharacterized protein